MAEISSATGKLLALSMLAGVGPATLRKLALDPNFVDASPASLATNNPALARALEAPGVWNKALILAEEQAAQAADHHAQILSPLDVEYPALLAATKDDPYLLYVRGHLAPSPEKSVAIIGTREPTAHGEVIATRIARYFVERSWSVVSGLALGCDAIAHRAALDAHGHTVAVLAHGLHTIAPAKHRSLAEDIIHAGGALVSQYPFGREVIPQQFAQRDRTQAGLAQGVVMIQSDLKGGSLHASRAILDYGRWLAVPYPTESDRSAGEAKVQANLLLADGTVMQKVDLLRCRNENALSRLIILRSKEDYASCLRLPAAPKLSSPEPSQSSMF